MQKIQLAAQGMEHGPGHDPRTDHLRPVIDFLLAQGNEPARHWHPDGFWENQGGELHYTFAQPIDAALLREHFVFPPSIQLQEDGRIVDGLNHFDIFQEGPFPKRTREEEQQLTDESNARLEHLFPESDSVPTLLTEEQRTANEHLQQLIDNHNSQTAAS